jgi:hypothetical protein
MTTVATRDTTAASRRTFQPSRLHVPAAAEAFFRHAIAPDARLPVAVRLTMHGHIKIGTWWPFTAEQIIDPQRGFRWTARVAGGVLSGADWLDAGQAHTRFALGGVIPVVRASGPDTTRSAFGRLLAERAIWLPGSLLPSTGTRWHADDDGRLVAVVPNHGVMAAVVPEQDWFSAVALDVALDGRVRDLTMPRWGRAAGRPGWVPFGMVALEEATFGDFTVPTRGRVGWWYGTPRWPAGEFFRFTIDDYEPF